MALWTLHPSEAVWLSASVALGALFFLGFFIYLRQEDHRSASDAP